MSKTVWDIHQEAIDKYNTRNNTFEMFPPGARVKVITPCEDFCFFYGETGTVVRNGHGYLSIIVKFDKIRKYEDRTTMSEWNFNPSSLILLNDKPPITCLNNPWVETAIQYSQHGQNESL